MDSTGSIKDLMENTFEDYTEPSGSI